MIKVVGNLLSDEDRALLERWAEEDQRTCSSCNGDVEARGIAVFSFLVGEAVAHSDHNLKTAVLTCQDCGTCSFVDVGRVAEGSAKHTVERKPKKARAAAKADAQ